MYFQEREQLREMQNARDAEERTLRDQARRQDEEARRQSMMDKMAEREREMQKDMDRMNRYGHLQYNDPAQRSAQTNNMPPGGGQEPPTSRYSAVPPSGDTPTNRYGAPPTTTTTVGRYGAPPGGQDPTKFNAPPPPERNSSYDIANQHGYRGPPGGKPGTPTMDINGQMARSSSASALKQPEFTPGSAKKSVSFHSDLATEIRENQQFASVSSEGDYQHPIPQGQQPNYPYRGGSTSNQPEPSPFYRPNYGPPTTGIPGGYNGPGTPNDVFAPRTPDNMPEYSPIMVAGPTPGVVGAQEVYRDPRDRIAAQRRLPGSQDGPIPERMSFRDKMKMFASEAGEQNTPKDRAKISSAQRVIETNINGQ